LIGIGDYRLLGLLRGSVVPFFIIVIGGWCHGLIAEG